MRPKGTQQKAARSQIVDVIHIQMAPEGSRQVVDTSRDMHPNGTQREAARLQILVVLCIQMAPEGSRQIADTNRDRHPKGTQREAKKGMKELIYQKKYLIKISQQPQKPPSWSNQI